jgi:hypothetical protein
VCPHHVHSALQPSACYVFHTAWDDAKFSVDVPVTLETADDFQPSLGFLRVIPHRSMSLVTSSCSGGVFTPCLGRLCLSTFDPHSRFSSRGMTYGINAEIEIVKVCNGFSSPFLWWLNPTVQMESAVVGAFVEFVTKLNDLLKVVKAWGLEFEGWRVQEDVLL